MYGLQKGHTTYCVSGYAAHLEDWAKHLGDGNNRE